MSYRSLQEPVEVSVLAVLDRVVRGQPNVVASHNQAAVAAHRRASDRVGSSLSQDVPAADLGHPTAARRAVRMADKGQIPPARVPDRSRR